MKPIDLINGALLDIGARAAGETATPEDCSEALTLLNAMLDQWSNEKMMLYCVQEVIHELTPSTYTYTIGENGSVGASFTGSIAGTVLTVTSLASGAISVGQVLSGVGTSITSLGTGRGGTGLNALGTYNLSLSQNVASMAMTSYAQRPIRINSAFVRINNSASGTLDYPLSIIAYEDYELIGIKTLNGPWPRAIYYQPSLPVGVLNYWPNPAQGEVHMFCDTILNRFTTLNDDVVLPQGYEMALRNNLSVFLMPGYGKVNAQQLAMIGTNATNGKALIKRTNMRPQPTAKFDVALTHKGRDASFILHGGFL